MPCVILGKWSQAQGEEGQARKKTLVLEGGEPGACPNSALGRLGNLGHVSILRPWSLHPVDWAGCHLRPLLSTQPSEPGKNTGQWNTGGKTQNHLQFWKGILERHLCVALSGACVWIRANKCQSILSAYVDKPHCYSHTSSCTHFLKRKETNLAHV